MKQLAFHTLIVGAGPAGLAAASSAARSGKHIGLLDDNPTTGGQIWRGGLDSAPNTQARNLQTNINNETITLFPRTRVVAPLEPGMLLAETPTEAFAISYERLILATGARERFLPFPGWTLPGVMGAGGLQALVKGGLPIAGKQVVVAGSGPLLLAAAAYLTHKEARVRVIAEQTSWRRLTNFALNLWRYPAHIRQSFELGTQLVRTPIRASSWVVEAHGTDHLEAVTLNQMGKIRRIECDYLACGFGLVPNVELPLALGCEVIDGAVRIDERQQTNRPGVYAAGEVTGIGGLDLSLTEGFIAGLAATGQLDNVNISYSKSDRTRSFAALLERSFALRPELKTLARADTLVCRCEDVAYQELQQHTNWRSAKLHTRCGMGPCQGRVCGAATGFLFGWTHESVRPPITPARIASLVQIAKHQNQPEEITQ